MSSVELFVYDLSHGMIRQFSQAFLGKQLDGIWHTGVVVYGTEYFYGGGIQSAPPGQTIAGKPLTKHHIGNTSVPKELFEEFLQEIAPRFTPETYSLLKHNCNNFSNELALFLTGNSIPDYILNLPEHAFDSPMGQMLKPMIENFEAQMRGTGAQAAPAFIPWTQPQQQPASIPTQKIQEVAEKKDIIEAKDISEESLQNLAELSMMETVQISEHRHFKLGLEIVSRTSKPLLSRDFMGKQPADFVPIAQRKCGLNSNQVDTLKKMVSVIEKVPEHKSLVTIVHEFEAIVDVTPSKNLFALLAILRLALLQEEVAKLYSRGKFADSLLKTICRCFPGMDISDIESESSILSVKLMILCCMANLTSHGMFSHPFAVSDTFRTCALTALQDSQKTIRVMGAAIVYNCALILRKSEDDLDVIVELLSASAHAASSENDLESLRRLLLAVSHLIFCNDLAADLLLTFDHDFSAILDRATRSSEGDKVLRKQMHQINRIVQDILRMLQV